MDSPVKQLADTFAVLQPNLRIQAVSVTPTLYADLDSDYAGFKGHVLIAAHEFSEDWRTWERHPAGDEIVLLLSGKAELVLKTSAGDESLVLDAPGSYVVIPQDTWHTARVSQPTRMLFMTPGEGTENRAEPPAENG